MHSSYPTHMRIDFTTASIVTYEGVDFNLPMVLASLIRMAERGEVFKVEYSPDRETLVLTLVRSDDG